MSSNMNNNQIFTKLSTPEGKKILDTMSKMLCSQVTLKDRKGLEAQLVTFMRKHMNLKYLQKYERTSNIMSQLPVGGLEAVATTIFNYMEENPEDSINKFFYHLALFTSLQTLSGYPIYGKVMGEDGEMKDPTPWFYENRQAEQDRYLASFYRDVTRTRGFLQVMHEADADSDKFPLLIAEGAQFVRLTGGVDSDKTLLRAEHGVVIVCSPNFHVIEWTHEQIASRIATIFGQQGAEQMRKSAKTIAVATVTHHDTGEEWTVISGHPKSFGSAKDLERNAQEVQVAHMVKDYCLKHGLNPILMGDWNHPIKPPTDTLGLSQEQLDQLPFAQQEGWLAWLGRKLGLSYSTQTVGSGMYLPDFNQEDIPSIERVADPRVNSQVFKMKWGKRQYLRDYIAPVNTLLTNQPDLEIYPRAEHTPSIPTAGEPQAEKPEERQPWTSDHPLICLEMDTGKSTTVLSVFNRLADNSLGSNIVPEDMEAYRREMPELLSNIWQDIITPA